MDSNYTYKLTDTALDDIDNAINYIANILHAEESAKSLYYQIEEKIDIICKTPTIQHNCKYYNIDDENFRYIHIKNYALFFHINKTKKQIEILRFLYAKMNITKEDIK